MIKESCNLIGQEQVLVNDFKILCIKLCKFVSEGINWFFILNYFSSGNTPWQTKGTCSKSRQIWARLNMEISPGKGSISLRQPFSFGYFQTGNTQTKMVVSEICYLSLMIFTCKKSKDICISLPEMLIIKESTILIGLEHLGLQLMK